MADMVWVEMAVQRLIDKYGRPKRADPEQDWPYKKRRSRRKSDTVKPEEEG